MTKETNNQPAAWQEALQESARRVRAVFKSVPEWMGHAGPQAELVLSTRIRLARNLTDYAFPCRARAEDLLRAGDEVCAAIAATKVLPAPVFLDLARLARGDRAVLVERRLISPVMKKEYLGARVVFGAGELASIMINEEDHLRLQTFQAGSNLAATWQAMQQLDHELGAHLEYAFRPPFGFLTSCPTNTGTGLRASLLMHLPALSLLKQMESIAKEFLKRGITVRGFYGEGTEATGSLYQISNQVTLGRSEDQILALVQEVANFVIEFEQKARAQLLGKQKYAIEDKVWRTYGILRYARRLSSVEFFNLLSILRLGGDLHLLRAWPPELLNRLMLITQPYHLRKLHKTALAAEKRDEMRARLVQEVLALTD